MPEYLFKYKVRDNPICNREGCEERGDIIHMLYECEKILPLMATLFTFLKQACHLNIDISMKDYLFGFTGAGWEGLNLIFIELKKYMFYDWSEGSSIEFHKIRFLNRMKRIMIKEKKLL